LIKKGKKYPEQFRLKTKSLGFVTERFSQYLASAVKHDWLMKMQGNEGEKQILLEVKIPQGVFRERVTVEEPLKHNVELDWSLNVMLPIFARLTKLKDAVLSVACMKDGPYYLLTAAGVSVVLNRKKV
jgi:hypothetical protein